MVRGRRIAGLGDVMTKRLELSDRLSRDLFGISRILIAHRVFDLIANLNFSHVEILSHRCSRTPLRESGDCGVIVR